MKDFFCRLAEIYRAIDTAYHNAQMYYKFSCIGCVDNCCVTKFYHHTLIEELYLSEGLKVLDEKTRKSLISRAKEVIDIHKSSPEDVRIMCPANENGLCILYEYRPMICRIHGVPYELHKMDLTVEHGEGCHMFIAKNADKPKGCRVDRTRFYFAMADLEKEVREYFNFPGRYKKTTAEMILEIIKKLGN